MRFTFVTINSNTETGREQKNGCVWKRTSRMNASRHAVHFDGKLNFNAKTMRKNEHSTALKGHSLYYHVFEWIRRHPDGEVVCCFLAIIFSFRAHLFAFLLATSPPPTGKSLCCSSTLQRCLRSSGTFALLLRLYTVPSVFMVKP